MTSYVTRSFRTALAGLPSHVRRQARDAYRRFQDDPKHPGLRFKCVHPTRPIYSARVGIGYRAVGQKDGDDIVWFWIGDHSDYDRLIGGL